MKIALKPSYLILVSAIALTSCSQEEEPSRTDGESRKILFRTSLPENLTRAEVINTNNLPYFYVTAFNFDDPSLMNDGVMKPLFAYEKVDIDSDKYAYTSPKCCWPELGKESHEISFYGFYPGPAELDGTQLINTSTDTSIDYKLTGFRVAKDIAEQVDFITAYTTGTMTDNLFSGVSLSFAHQLSRIEIKAYGAHESCDIEIAGVRIGGTGVKGTFDFKPVDGGGVWLDSPTRGIVEYVYRNGDKIVKCGKNNKVDKDNAMSIMGSEHIGNEYIKSYDNCAMLIPSTYAQWDYINDNRNFNNKMYISVLLRVTDATPTAGINPVEKQRFPYKDLSQGANALKVPVVYLAVKKATGIVSTRLYKNGSSYFKDPAFSDPYNHPAEEEIKEFGWAAVPVTGTWLPGNIYTYTLDYTYGVGLLDPEVTTTAPSAGDPVISDRVGLTYTVREWKSGGGSNFPVPGS